MVRSDGAASATGKPASVVQAYFAYVAA